MKFHFGHGIAIVLTLFVLTFVWLGIMAHRQDFQLKTDNYYETDRNYPAVFDKMQNAANAGMMAFPSFQTSETVCFQLPDTLDTDELALTIRAYRPADKHLDKDFPSQPDSSGIACLPKDMLAKGLYEITFDMEYRGIGYLVEQKLFVD